MKNKKNPPRQGGGQIEIQPTGQSKEISMPNYNTPGSPELPSSFLPLPSNVYLPEELGADASPWMDATVGFIRKWSPESFGGFPENIALFVLSTIAARRVSYNLGATRYTNLYFALVGRTSIYAKTTAAEIGIDVISKAGLDWLLAPDNSTPQKFIQDMASNELPANYQEMDEFAQERTRLRLLFAGQRGWFVDEFGNQIAAMMRSDGVMSDFRSLLRRFDDTPPYYETATLGRGNNRVINPYLALLVNLTPADLLPFVKIGATLWGDGFLARFMLVTPPDSDIKFARFPNEQRVIPANLITPLNRWHKKLGIPEYSIKSNGDKSILNSKPIVPQKLTIPTEVYDAFYNYRDALRQLTLFTDLPDLDGNYTRFSEKAIRISALLASQDGYDQIEMKHWARAQSIAERGRIGLHELYEQVTNAEPRKPRALTDEEKVLRIIRIKQDADKRLISQYTKIVYDDLNPIFDKLLAEGKIMYEIIGDKTVFKLATTNIQG